MKSIFTDKEDNLELASVLTVGAAALFAAISLYCYLVSGQTFDPMNWGAGAGAITAGGGVAKLTGNRGDYDAS